MHTTHAPFSPWLILWGALLLALGCAVVGGLKQKSRDLLWQAVALGLLTASAWLQTRSAAVGWLVAVPLWGWSLCTVQALAMRMGQRVSRGVLLISSVCLAAASLLAMQGSVVWAQLVLPLGLGINLGHILPHVWRAASRSRLERVMLVAYSLMVATWMVLPWAPAPVTDFVLWYGVLAYSVLFLVNVWHGPSLLADWQLGRDSGTGVMTARALQKACSPEPFNLGLRVFVLCELDQLQLQQQQHGRAAGERLLRSFAQVLQRNVRDGDWVGRLSHEEFAIALRGLTMEEAQNLVTRINEQLTAMLPEAHPSAQPLTASFGLAMIHESDSFDTMLHRADVLLHQAKDAGRNCMWSEQLMANKGAAFGL